MADISVVLQRIKKHLKAEYGDAIKRMLVYGSFARNMATGESDVDILVIVADGVEATEVEEGLSDLLFQILLNQGELVSAIAVNESLFENYRSPLFLNVREEGVISLFGEP